jgi:hypothetical protein
MRLLILFTTVAFCLCRAIAQPNDQSTGDSQGRPGLPSENQRPAAKPAPFPLQLEMWVPFEPTAFPNERSIYVMYELHLTNFGTAPLYLSRIEVLDAQASAAQPIATFNAEQLDTMLQPVGTKTSAGAKENYQIVGGGSAIVFVSIALDRGSRVPDKLLHRVVTTESLAEGAVITTHHTTLRVLWPPVQGENWLASDGPSNGPDNPSSARHFRFRWPGGDFPALRDRLEADRTG